jgi:hypothetical protein
LAVEAATVEAAVRVTFAGVVVVAWGLAGVMVTPVGKPLTEIETVDENPLIGLTETDTAAVPPPVTVVLDCESVIVKSAG